MVAPVKFILDLLVGDNPVISGVRGHCHLFYLTCLGLLCELLTRGEEVLVSAFFLKHVREIETEELGQVLLLNLPCFLQEEGGGDCGVA